MIFAEESQPDLFQQLLALLAAIVMPVWNDLILLIPIVLVVLVVIYLIYTLWQWRRNSARNKPRLIARYAGSPPPGVHLPGPARWVAVVPVAIALIFFGVLFWWVWIAVGLIVGIIAAWGWVSDAGREWDRTTLAEASGGHLGAGSMPAGALTAGASSAVAIMPAGGALVPAGEAALAVPEQREPPPGVHLPGPSPWPFFAPIALMVLFYGVIFSPALIVGGIVLGAIAAVGWLLDANREWRSTEVVGHAVPRTRDPRAVWPRRLVWVFFWVIVVSVIVAGLPAIGNFLAGLAPGPASPSQVAVPAKPEISASSAVSFDTKTLIVPAGRPFELVFHNKNEGVPHNVEIANGPDLATTYFAGERITGVRDITYQVPVLAPGNYYFLCIVHPNMNGTVEAVPEAGAGGSPQGPPGSAPSPSATAP
jgi:plastocyanin